MRALRETIAVALPADSEWEAVTDAVATARRGRLPIDVRIGVGLVDGPIPARILGHAHCVAEALRVDVPSIGGPATTVTVFSSIPKLHAVGGLAVNTTDVALGLATFGAALRLAGVASPIVIEEALDEIEIPTPIHQRVWFPPTLAAWLQRAATKSGTGADPLLYGMEHASPSMFADLGNDQALRLTIGAVPEARFWIARRQVRQEAHHQGLSVVPAIGLVLRGCARPWYQPTSMEPRLYDLLECDADEIVKRIDRSANPRRGGNAGLKREMRATRQMVGEAGARRLAESSASVDAAVALLRSTDVKIGARLKKRLEEIQE